MPSILRMQSHPLVYRPSKTYRAARHRRLLEKFALALVGAALLATFLFALVHLNEAVRNWGVNN